MANNLLESMESTPSMNSQIFQSVHQELQFGASLFNQSNPGSSQKDYYYEKQCWMVVIVSIYKTLANSYDPFRRRILKHIFTALANQDLEDPVQCLRWLENHRL